MKNSIQGKSKSEVPCFVIVAYGLNNVVELISCLGIFNIFTSSLDGCHFHTITMDVQRDRHISLVRGILGTKAELIFLRYEFARESLLPCEITISKDFCIIGVPHSTSFYVEKEIEELKQCWDKREKNNPRLILVDLCGMRL